MKTLIVYFSWSEDVALLAEHVRGRLRPAGEVEMARIRSVKEHGYWGWLARSFIPGWRVPIQPVITHLAPYDLVCLGFPKWTLACPPLNQYIRAMDLRPGQRMGVFMSYGGFDQERYLREILQRLTKKGAKIAGAASIRRCVIRDGSFGPAVDSFCREILRDRAE